MDGKIVDAKQKEIDFRVSVNDIPYETRIPDEQPRHI